MSVFQITEFMLWKYLNKKAPKVGTIMDMNISQSKNEFLGSEMICRVCTNPATISLNEKWNNILIMSALRTVTNIVINEADYYPKHICTICLEELKISYNFRKKCEATDVMLRTAISSTTILNTNSRLMVTHDFSLILHQIKLKRLASQIVTDVKEEIQTDVDENYDNFSNSDIKPQNEEKYSNFKFKYNADDSSGNSSDNEVISSLCNRTKIIKTEKRKKSNKSLRQLKVKKRKTAKKKMSKPNSSNIQQTIVNLLDMTNMTNNTDLMPRCNIKKVTKKKLLRCRRCDFKFDTKKEYDEHKEQNNCVYRSCPKCGKLVLNLLKHEKIMHLRSEKYTCDQCGKIYYSSSALYNHMNVHKKSLEYSCDLCSYKGKRKSYLVCHMLVHTGERRYLCSECPAKFSNNSNLRKHQLLHLNKTFECNRCKKMFRDAKTLKQHNDFVHLNIRYRCSICGRELCSRKKLLNHELRVHKREKHKLFDNEQKVVVISSEK